MLWNELNWQMLKMENQQMFYHHLLHWSVNRDYIRRLLYVRPSDCEWQLLPLHSHTCGQLSCDICVLKDNVSLLVAPLVGCQWYLNSRVSIKRLPLFFSYLATHIMFVCVVSIIGFRV